MKRHFAVQALAGLAAFTVALSAQATQEQQAAKVAEEKARPAIEKREIVQKVLALKYAEPLEVTSTLRVFEVSAVPNSNLKIIAVRGSRESVMAFEEAVKRLDVPSPAPRNIELTGYLLEGSQQPGSGAAVPPELDAVVKQLKAVFAFQELRLLDTLALRSREGEAAVGVNGVLSSGQRPNTPYEFSFRSARSTADERGRLIRIDRLTLNVHSTPRIGLSADVDFREGQKVVVGKTGMEGSNRALILVLTGKVVD